MNRPTSSIVGLLLLLMVTLSAGAAEPAGQPSTAASEENGRHWRLATEQGPVHAWIPAGYQAATAVLVIYVHGYYTTVDSAWQEHRLAAQFAGSGINALFLAPEAPAGPRQPVRWPNLAALLAAVAVGLPIEQPQGTTVVVGHSGAYRTIACWLTDPVLSRILLVDGLYAYERELRSWLRLADHRLVLVSVLTFRQAQAMSHKVYGALGLSALDLDGWPTFDSRPARLLHLDLRGRFNHFELISKGLVLPALLKIAGLPPLAALAALSAPPA